MIVSFSWSNKTYWSHSIFEQDSSPDQKKWPAWRLVIGISWFHKQAPTSQGNKVVSTLTLFFLGWKSTRLLWSGRDQETWVAKKHAMAEDRK